MNANEKGKGKKKKCGLWNLLQSWVQGKKMKTGQGKTETVSSSNR